MKICRPSDKHRHKNLAGFPASAQRIGYRTPSLDDDDGGLKGGHLNLFFIKHR